MTLCHILPKRRGWVNMIRMLSKISTCILCTYGCSLSMYPYLCVSMSVMLIHFVEVSTCLLRRQWAHLVCDVGWGSLEESFSTDLFWKMWSNFYSSFGFKWSLQDFVYFLDSRYFFSQAKTQQHQRKKFQF